MTTVQGPMTGTVFDAILASLRAAADYHKDDVVPPAAILWTDEKREWERLVPRLRMVLPHFLVFGPYDKANRTGPAIWLRCVLAGRIPDVSIPPDCVPIIYLPGVSRVTLRATEECPQELKPLAELQYRGVFWSQTNGKDWTVAALLQTNHGGLQLKLAKDAATATSIRRSIEKLVDVPVDELRAKAASGELNSTYFDLLVSDDPVDDLLTWLSDPKGTRDRWEPNRWETLCSRCIADYGFDPARDGEVVAAEKLGLQEKSAWKTAWKRFAATPARYLGLVELLRKAKPKAKAGDLLALQRVEFWPQDNEARETELRQALAELVSLPAKQASERIKELEKGHAERRQWVWAKLNRSPLAQAVEHLAALAEIAQAPLGGATTADMVRAYTEGGWQADAAVLDALAVVATPRGPFGRRKGHGPRLCPLATGCRRTVPRAAEEKARAGAGRSKIGRSAEGDVHPVRGRAAVRRWAEAPRACWNPSWADGGQAPVGRPAERHADRKAGSIARGRQDRRGIGRGGVPALGCCGRQRPDASPIQGLLEEEGFQVLALAETGDPAGRAWTEFGNLDKTGHEEGVGLARRIPEILAGLVQRITSSWLPDGRRSAW